MLASRFLPNAVAATLILFTLTLTAGSSIAGEHQRTHKSAIVLAMFGTTVEPALDGLLNIKKKMEKRFPNTPVKIAFTSNIIRKIWQKRAADPLYRKQHPEIPDEILQVQGPLATLANLQDQGYDTIVVQPTHIAPAEEFLDLCSYVEALASIETIKERFKPFNKLVVGRPALGTYGTKHPYAEDIKVAAGALREDAELAKKKGAALVYMGHGNEFFPSGGSYLEFESEMNKIYPDVLTFVGNVEGYPDFERLLGLLKHAGVKKVVIKPMMVVAGDHAMNDMAGSDQGSWKSMLEKAGIEVVPVLRGLGQQDAFAEIFVQHAIDAAKDAGIELK
jgi:sirohydrochlorin cobaltochelatase